MLWKGDPVIRDNLLYLVTGEESAKPVLVGARAGGGGMTCGMKLKNQGDNATYMLQCRHGYKAVGHILIIPGHMLTFFGDQCSYLVPSRIKAAVDQLKDQMESQEDNVFPVEHLRLLKRVGARAEGPSTTYCTQYQIIYLSIGIIGHLSPPHLDAAITKLRLQKYSIECYVLKPPIR